MKRSLSDKHPFEHIRHVIILERTKEDVEFKLIQRVFITKYYGKYLDGVKFDNQL